MRTIIIILIILLRYSVEAQTVIPSIEKLKGNWLFKEDLTQALMIVKENKAILLIYSSDNKDCHSYGTPFSYFGFWDSDNKPKKISDLKKEGKHIYFYDNLGTSYDASGNLIKETRSTILTFNEDEDENEYPPVLRFYYKGTPDTYVKVDSIPEYVLKALKRNMKSWQAYVNFIGIKEEKIIKTGKSIIYLLPNEPSKMFLVKGDTVTVLQEKDNWIYILYVTSKNKEIKGWVKKEDVDVK